MPRRRPPMGSFAFRAPREHIEAAKRASEVKGDDLQARHRGDPMNTTRPQRYDQCDDDCTVDCGHCKGKGRPVDFPTYMTDGIAAFATLTREEGAR
jgi:hypothetical protein